MLSFFLINVEALDDIILEYRGCYHFHGVNIISSVLDIILFSVEDVTIFHGVNVIIFEGLDVIILVYMMLSFLVVKMLLYLKFWMLSFFRVSKCYHFCVIIFPSTCWLLSFILCYHLII